MRIFVKICGLSTRDAVKAAVDAGADALGFVLAESPRRVTAAEAARLCRDVPYEFITVAVLQHPDQDEWDGLRALFRPDWVQADVADFDQFQPGTSIRRLPVYRDGPDLDIDAAGREDLLLFESVRSGAGQMPDLGRAAQIAAMTRVVIAGGLDPDNVADVIDRVRPFGVDVSSGVESSRGRKDPGKIRAFIEAVREAESRHAD